MPIDSIHFNGKCENCGKDQPSLTIPVHPLLAPGVHGDAEWCLDCVQGKNPVDTSKIESG